MAIHQSQALKLPGPYALCNTRKVLPDDYLKQIDQRFPHDLPLGPNGGHVGGILGKRDQGPDAREEKYRPLPYDESKPSPTYTVEIDRISNSGNGIVYIHGREINIGPVKEEAEGSEVEVEIIDHQSGECKTDNICPESERDGDQSEPSSHSKETESRKAEEVLSTENSSYKYETGTDTFPHKTNSTQGGDETRTKTDVVDKATENDEQDDRKDGETETEENSSTSETLESDPDIEELRDKAEKNAVEEVTQDVSTNTTEKPQYNRSPEVREYVKARADGTCEGCGDPAPFTSKTGDPYLHAHHIHELSDGGSDTPESVIALCPNCHYRIHHGEDGDKYNKELLQKLEEKE